ncbi:hypothetical protein NDU88_007266 [Pleurodeles waltl]|uniref:Uncharacterized protein n=1 Tax=Pleurodeles waltl TaxID=8319 RepID=A0AAV7LX78_PLEWA|nr:hypothetical protein NDU88_007266 [Pleurodeles waltl]
MTNKNFSHWKEAEHRPTLQASLKQKRHNKEASFSLERNRTQSHPASFPGTEEAQKRRMLLTGEKQNTDPPCKFPRHRRGTTKKQPSHWRGQAQRPALPASLAQKRHNKEETFSMERNSTQSQPASFTGTEETQQRSIFLTAEEHTQSHPTSFPGTEEAQQRRILLTGEKQRTDPPCKLPWHRRGTTKKNSSHWRETAQRPTLQTSLTQKNNNKEESFSLVRSSVHNIPACFPGTEEAQQRSSLLTGEDMHKDLLCHCPWHRRGTTKKNPSQWRGTAHRANLQASLAQKRHNKEESIGLERNSAQSHPASFPGTKKRHNKEEFFSLERNSTQTHPASFPGTEEAQQRSSLLTGEDKHKDLLCQRPWHRRGTTKKNPSQWRGAAPRANLQASLATDEAK